MEEARVVPSDVCGIKALNKVFAVVGILVRCEGRILAVLVKSFYWLQLGKEVRVDRRLCLVYQLDKY